MERLDSVQNGVYRLTVRKSVVDQSKIPVSSGRVELEVRNWRDVFRRIEKACEDRTRCEGRIRGEREDWGPEWCKEYCGRSVEVGS